MASSKIPITFYYPFPEDLKLIDTIDLFDWQFWSASWLARRRAWCLRTYLQLREAGYPVAISSSLPDEGIIVIGPELNIRRQYLSYPWSRRRHLFVLSIRADLTRCTFADASLVQNGRFHDGIRTFHIPHWPQPGLIPRNSDRGSIVDTIAFKGYGPNLNAHFSSKAWQHFLSQNGMKLQTDMNTRGPDGTPIRWHDYQKTDVVLAVRPEMDSAYFSKPATKLYNAWAAGVPAILGPEFAYKELRRSPLDYLEVRTIEEVKKALLCLRRNSELYTAMVENGRRRAADFTFDRITEIWAHVLFEQVIPLASRTQTSSRKFTPLHMRRIQNLVRTPIGPDEFKVWSLRYRTELKVLLSKIRPALGRMRRRLQSVLARGT